MRKMIWDQQKTITQLRRDQGKTCTIPGCNSPVTHMQGPGSSTLCREHQLKLADYEGGMGRMDRPHTFHRKHFCEECGYNPFEDPKYEKYKDNPALFNRLCRNQIIGDHQHRRSDGGEDTEENIKSLCLRCNADKTILNEDYRKGTKFEKLLENNHGSS